MAPDTHYMTAIPLPHVVLIIGVCLVAYGLSGIDGTGHDWYFGYHAIDRYVITGGAGLVALGFVTRRRGGGPDRG